MSWAVYGVELRKGEDAEPFLLGLYCSEKMAEKAAMDEMNACDASPTLLEKHRLEARNSDATYVFSWKKI